MINRIQMTIAAGAAIFFAGLPAAHAADAVASSNLPPGLDGKPEGNMAKANGALRVLFAEFQAYQRGGSRGAFAPSNQRIQFDRGRVVVDITAVGDANALLPGLRGLGLENAAVAGRMISGFLPVGQISRLLAMGGVQAASASYRPITNAGLVTSEGVDAMNVPPLHTAGIDGSGVKVGVISDSFDWQHDMATDIANDDLPADTTLLDDSCTSSCNDEGRAMAQLIHDVAPGSAISFHTALGGMANFATGIQDLADAGADFIVDDIIYFAEPMFQDGVIAQAVDDVKSQGVGYYSAAGNQADQSYSSAFVSANEHLFVQGLFGLEDRGVLHDFDPGPGIDYMQQITIPSGGSLILMMQWTEPFGSASVGTGSATDMDVYLTDDNLLIYAESIDDNLASGDPIEMLTAPFSGTFNILITNFDGPAPTEVKYIIFNGLSISTEYATNSPTLFGHPNADGAVGVGAAFYQQTPAYGQTPPLSEYFTSLGGTKIYFDNNGNLLGTPVLRQRPQLTAPDGTNTTFFYADSPSDPDTDPNFFGTSAAAPHAAAVAALLRDKNAGASADDIQAAMESTAIDMNTPGYDYLSGYGLVDANAAGVVVGDGGSGGNQAPTPVDDNYNTSRDTQLVVAAPGMLGNDTDPDGDPLTAVLDSGPSNGTLDSFGADGSFSYTPGSGFSGKDSFTYFADDGTDQVLATVTINVTKGRGGGGSGGGGGGDTGGGGGGDFCTTHPDHKKCT